MKSALRSPVLLLTLLTACGNRASPPSSDGGASGGGSDAKGGAALTAGAPSGGASAEGGNGGATSNGGIGGSAGTFRSDNLLKNGDAENGTSDWSAAAGAEIAPVDYGATDYPSVTDPGPKARGKAFFTGGNAANASAHQLVDLTPFAAQISVGARYELSAYLGGYAAQDDRASVVLTFFGPDQAPLATATLGGPFAAERVEMTGLFAGKLDGRVPADARSVDVQLVMTRAGGQGNDGYADALALMLHD